MYLFCPTTTSFQLCAGQTTQLVPRIKLLLLYYKSGLECCSLVPNRAQIIYTNLQFDTIYFFS